MKYAVIFEKTQTGYSAYPPDLAGVGVAGATIDEARQLLTEAIEMHLAGCARTGLRFHRPPRTSKKSRFSAERDRSHTLG